MRLLSRLPSMLDGKNLRPHLPDMSNVHATASKDGAGLTAVEAQHHAVAAMMWSACVRREARTVRVPGRAVELQSASDVAVLPGSRPVLSLVPAQARAMFTRHQRTHPNRTVGRCCHNRGYLPVLYRVSRVQQQGR